VTYEEKLAELEKLKAEIAGRPQFLTSWDSETLQSFTERCEADEVEVAAPAAVEAPLEIDPAEALHLFPKTMIEPMTCVGRKGLPDEFVHRMYRCYLRGKSVAEVGKIYKRSRQSVHETFRRRGLKLRPDSKALAKIEFEYRGVKYAPGKTGYLRATTGKRRTLESVIWEEFNGPLPANHQIVFRDGNNRNFALENLECLANAVVLERGRRINNERRAA
jgi:hypothetical protein